LSANLEVAGCGSRAPNGRDGTESGRGTVTGKDTPVLDVMRRHARSWLIKVALGGVIVVFIFWYGWSGPQDKSRGYMAKVNGTVISQDFFHKVYDDELDKARRRFKGGIPPAVMEELKKDVATLLIHRVLLLQEGQRLGIEVTDQELRQDILTTPRFQRNGTFDQAVYADFLRSTKLSPSLYEEDRRKQIIEQQVAHLLTDSVKTDPEEIKRFWHFQSDKLALSCLMVKPDSEKADTSPETKELETYFKEHQRKYAIPPAVDIQYVEFSWRDAEKQLSVSDEEALSYFQMNPREFVVPENLRLRQILLTVPPEAEQEAVDAIRTKAESALGRIKAGEDFSKVAQEMSEDDVTKDKGGDLGLVARGTMNPAIEKAATKLEPGQVSEPIRTAQGYHVIKLEEKQPETALDFPTVKERIVKKLLTDRAKKKINLDSEAFYEQVYRTEDLEGPAQKFGFTIRKAEGVRKGGAIPEVGDDQKIIQEAFDLRTGEISKLLRLGDNFVVMKVVKVTNERLPTFDEVREQLAKDYIKAQALIKTRQKAGEIIEELKKPGQDPVEVAKRFGLTWENLDPVSRTAGFLPQLGSSPDVTEMLTTVSEAAPLFPIPIAGPQGVAVVRLLSVQPASEIQFEKEAPMVERWVREVRQTEFLKGWLGLLEKKSEIELADRSL
jgi:peptidyl-prolyl cis-trans isomerase D